jgi:hypothetical protein
MTDKVAQNNTENTNQNRNNSYNNRNNNYRNNNNRLIIIDHKMGIIGFQNRNNSDNKSQIEIIQIIDFKIEIMEKNNYQKKTILTIDSKTEITEKTDLTTIDIIMIIDKMEITDSKIEIIQMVNIQEIITLIENERRPLDDKGNDKILRYNVCRNC